MTAKITMSRGCSHEPQATIAPTTAPRNGTSTAATLAVRSARVICPYTIGGYRLRFLAPIERSGRVISTNAQVSPLERTWQALDPAVGDAIAPRIAAIADEITAAIGDGIPEYRQPMGGAFGQGVRDAIDATLRQFL